MGGQAKVWFDLHGEPVGSESLWAERVAESLYRLLNVPFYVKRYAEGDIVRCVDHDGRLEVVGIEKDSGNGTLWLMFTDVSHESAQRVLSELTSVGCTYEQASERLIGVTVPPGLTVPFSQLANYLNSIDDEALPGWEIGKRLTRVVH